jgi:capsule polysaccharide modification protein KpsS
MEYKQNTRKKGSVKIRLDSTKGLWDLVLAAPSTYCGNDVFEVPAYTLQVLDKKGIAYKRIQETSAH